MKLRIVEKKYYQNGIRYIGNGTFINDQCEVVFAYEGTEISSYDSNFIILKKRGVYLGVSNSYESVFEYKYGLITSTGEIILEFDWDYIGDFSEGLIVVKSQNKYGFCDENGNIKIPLIYNFAFPFSNGVARVSNQDRKIVFLDKDGKVVIEYIWDDVESFSNELAAFKKEDKWGYINLQGEVVIKPRFSWRHNLNFDKNGLAEAAIDSDGVGVIDKTGRFVLDPICHSIHRDDEGNIESASCDSIGQKCAFLHDGKLLENIIWDGRGITNIYGMTIVIKNHQFGLIGKSGIISLPQWDSMGYLGMANQNLLHAVKKNNRWGFINEQGKLVIPLEYDDAENFIGGLAQVKKDGKYGVINKQGKVVIPFEWDEIRYEYIGLIKINKNNKWGLVDSNGKVILQPEWDRIKDFSEGLLSVQKDDKWGFVDNQGQIIIELIWDDTRSFLNGLAAVKKDDKWGYINTKGEIEIPLKWDSASSFENYNRSIVGEKHYYNGGKDYFHRDFLITRTGSKIKNTMYSGISFINDKILKIRNYNISLERSEYGFMDLNGNVLVELQFRYIKDFDQYGYAETNNGYIYLSQCNQDNEKDDVIDDIELIDHDVEINHNESIIEQINDKRMIESNEYRGSSSINATESIFDKESVKDSNDKSLYEDKIIKYLVNISRMMMFSIFLFFLFGVITFDNLWIAIPSLIIFLGSLFINWALTAK